MMSSSRPAPAPVPTVKSVAVSQANLFYKTADNQTWTRLPSTSLRPKFNIFNVDVKYTIKIEQRYPEGAGICTLMLKPEHYSSSPVKIDMDLENEDPNNADFLVDIVCQNIPPCTLSRTKKDETPPHYNLSDFLLATLSPSFTDVRLQLRQHQFRPKARQDILRERLVTFTSGATTRESGSEEHEEEELLQGKGVVAPIPPDMKQIRKRKFQLEIEEQVYLEQIAELEAKRRKIKEEREALDRAER